jgi:nucleoside-diphosphate-sugar epimerase
MSVVPQFQGDRRREAAYTGTGAVPQRRQVDHIDARLTPLGIASRVLGDAGITFFAILAAHLIAAFWLPSTGRIGSSDVTVGSLVPSIMLMALVLMSSVVVTNALLGSYSRNRTYPMRTKLIRLVQGAGLAGAVAGVAFLLLDGFMAVPRGVFLLAWLQTAVALPVARWWSWAYRIDVATRQARLDRQRQAAVRAVMGPDGDEGVVLVIGGAGYIGSALLPRLLESGRRVRLLDVFLYGRDPIASVIDHPNLEVVETDYRRFDKLVQAMQGVTTVVHLGGLVGDPACAWNEALTVEVNLTFTKVIAEVAKASGVKRFVFASTCSVYGASDEILDESSDLHPVSLYARSKIGSERVLTKLHDASFQVTILRFGTIYGISGRTRFDLVVNLLTAKARVDRGITVFGGDQWRPFVHVIDAARAVAMVIGSPVELVGGRTYNVGSDEQNATLGDVGKLIHRLVPEAEYIDSGRDGDRRNYRVSFRRIRDELGFLPEWSLEGGVRQVLHALDSGAVGNYRDPKYSNVLYLSERSDLVFRTTELEYSQALISDPTIDGLAATDRPSGQVRVGMPALHHRARELVGGGHAGELLTPVARGDLRS